MRAARLSAMGSWVDGRSETEVPDCREWCWGWLDDGADMEDKLGACCCEVDDVARREDEDGEEGDDDRGGGLVMLLAIVVVAVIDIDDDVFEGVAMARAVPMLESAVGSVIAFVVVAQSLLVPRR